MYKARRHRVPQNRACGLIPVVLASMALGSAALSIVSMIPGALGSVVIIPVALTSMTLDSGTHL